MKYVFIVSLSIIAILQIPCTLLAQHHLNKIIIEITNIKNNKGQIILDLYDNMVSYEQEKPTKRFLFPKQKIKDHKMEYGFFLPDGIYAIALIDDENMDNKINRNLVGFPLEGFGFSNFTRFPFKKPCFRTVSFELKRENKTVFITMQYR